MRRAWRRAWLELILVLLTGACHLIFDTALHLKAWYIAASVLTWTAYLGWRLRDRGQARDWGMRSDTLRPSLVANGVLLLVAGVAIVLYGMTRGRGMPSVGFFYLIALYPVWGLVQQLLLCPLLYSNLEKVSSSRAASMLIGAALFGLVHAPDWILALLTAAAATIWIALYRRWPNLWVQAFSHGWLGALAYYYALGRDPWAELMKSIGY